MKQGRKFGADMGQALLYGAFAIATLIGVLAVASVVQFSNTKREYATVLSMGSSAVNQYFDTNEYKGVFAPFSKYIIDTGSVPEAYRGNGDNPYFDIDPDDTHIKLPYGGSLEFAGGVHFEPPFRTNRFMAIMWWPENNRKTRALCKFMARSEADKHNPGMYGEGDFLTGPFGSNYRISAVSCDSSWGPYVVANYL